MANFVIKPTSSNDSIKFQGSDGSAQFTIAGTTGSLGSGIAFPAGHQIFIKKVTKSGTSGAVYRPTAFYPTATSDFASKSIYMSITSSEHSPYTKLLINVSCSFRIDKNSHTLIDARLARWTGTGNVSSETSLLQRMLGGASTNVDNEHYVSFSGAVVDDISSLGDVQVNYLVQYRCHAENAIHANNIYFGGASYDEHQINAFGII